MGNPVVCCFVSQLYSQPVLSLPILLSNQTEIAIISQSPNRIVIVVTPQSSPHCPPMCRDSAKLMCGLHIFLNRLIDWCME